MRLFEDIDVVGLGQTCFDSLCRVPSYPHEDGKVEWLDLKSQCVGPASTLKSTAAFNHRFFLTLMLLDFPQASPDTSPFSPIGVDKNVKTRHDDLPSSENALRDIRV